MPTQSDLSRTLSFVESLFVFVTHCRDTFTVTARLESGAAAELAIAAAASINAANQNTELNTLRESGRICKNLPVIFRVVKNLQRKTI